MLAISIPDLPDKVVGAIFAAAAATFLIAIRGTDRRWERLFIAGLGAIGLSWMYSALTTGSNLSDHYHTVVHLILTTAALGAAIAAITLSDSQRARFSATAVGLYLAPAWWASVLAWRCGTVTFEDCSIGFGMPAIMESLFYVAASALLFLVIREEVEEPPHRWIAAGLFAIVVYSAYATLMVGLDLQPPGWLSSAFRLIASLGALALFVLAARLSARARVLAFGLALLSLPGAYAAVVHVFGGAA